MSLFLVGMRGAGKSAAGALAGARLGVPFSDVDQAIEQRAGRSVASIFATHGEAAFRALERELLRELLPRPAALVALGAGAVADPEARAALRRYGRVVWLTARTEVLHARIRGSARPALSALAPREELAALAAEREPLYRQCADAQVDTSTLTLEEVAHVIEQLWTALPHHQLR
jgi:shikimate kinase